MPRIRTIKPDYFLDEDVAQLPYPVERTFIGLWVHADKAGRLEDRPMKLKVQIDPYREMNMDAALQELHEGGFITRYEVGGKKYLQINNFEKHQRPHHTETESCIPLPNGAITVKTPLLDGEAPVGKERGRGREGGKEGKGKEGKSTQAPLSNGVVEVFEHWQARMNHPGAKLDDRRKRKIQGALALGYSVADCREAIDGYANSPYHMGENERGTTYDTIDLIFRDADHIDEGIKMAKVPPRPLSDGDRRLKGNQRAAQDAVALMKD